MTNYFNPNDLFKLAKDLDSSNNSESVNRTILNRCYYSCYLRIKDECYRNRKGLGDYINHDSAFYRVNKRVKPGNKAWRCQIKYNGSSKNYFGYFHDPLTCEILYDFIKDEIYADIA